MLMLTILNNVGSKTLFNAVCIRPEQVVLVFRCVTRHGVILKCELGIKSRVCLLGPSRVSLILYT